LSTYVATPVGLTKSRGILRAVGIRSNVFMYVWFVLLLSKF